MITSFNQLDTNKKYTYADYLAWKFSERVELILGKIFKMSPGPSRLHQEVAGKLYVLLSNQLEGKDCKLYIAPFDVRPFGKEKTETDTVVQPDICIVCDYGKLDDAGCNGPPDLIIEILSPSTASKDLKEKYNMYELAGVKEYWTVDPVDGIINTYVLGPDGKYLLHRPYTVSDDIESKVIPGLTISLSSVFPNVLEEERAVYEDNVKRI